MRNKMLNKKILTMVLAAAMVVSPYAVLPVMAEEVTTVDGEEVTLISAPVKEEMQENIEELKDTEDGKMYKGKQDKSTKNELKEHNKKIRKELHELRKATGENNNKELKDQIKSIQFELKEQRKALYTAEERTAIEEKVAALKEEYKDIAILPVENVDVAGKNVKFDMPPVIKGGRTLVPVRAITEGLGAEVAWNQETQEVTITKDGVVIVLTIGSNLVKVNGEEITLDAEANVMGNRTYVPIRFISEQLKMNVNWDADNEVVEIEEPEEVEEVETEEVEEVETEEVETEEE